MDIWLVRGNLVYFSRFGILYQEKSGNPECDKKTGNSVLSSGTVNIFKTRKKIVKKALDIHRYFF
jgi:hypothetical protein